MVLLPVDAVLLVLVKNVVLTVDVILADAVRQLNERKGKYINYSISFYTLIKWNLRSSITTTPNFYPWNLDPTWTNTDNLLFLIFHNLSSFWLHLNGAHFNYFSLFLQLWLLQVLRWRCLQDLWQMYLLPMLSRGKMPLVKMFDQKNQTNSFRRSVFESFDAFLRIQMIYFSQWNKSYISFFWNKWLFPVEYTRLKFPPRNSRKFIWSIQSALNFSSWKAESSFFPSISPW